MRDPQRQGEGDISMWPSIIRNKCDSIHYIRNVLYKVDVEISDQQSFLVIVYYYIQEIYKAPLAWHSVDTLWDIE